MWPSVGGQMAHSIHRGFDSGGGGCYKWILTCSYY